MKFDHKIEVKRFFDAAHQLPDSEDLITKKCANLHGHTYYTKVVIMGTNDRHGMVVDFSGIKEEIDVLDHKYINDIFAKDDSFKDLPTTAENIAKFIFWKIQLKYDNLKVIEVEVYEGWKGVESSNSVSYYGNEN